MSTDPAPPPALPVRRVRFEYPDDLDPAWNRRLPEFAFGANSVSLLMPYAEPYFIRSIRAALPQLDQRLRPQVESFLRQESGHYRQHRRFNDLVASRYRGITRLERWIERSYGWLGRTRSVRFNVAFAAASETIAFALARWSEAHLDEFFDEGDSIATTLFLWHLAEEVEHKNVAYDVFEAIDGSRVRYSLAMLTTFTLLAWFATLGTLLMVLGSGRALKPVTYVRLLRWSVSLAFAVLPVMAASALPAHHPRDFADPVFLPMWLKQYDPATGTMPLWRAPASVRRGLIFGP
ncbi:metal-dependent hydrolase [Rhabdothermincola sp.]|uniref:metal-dependent hydrolase n=1 Tax=Rhabdothermincola sp. TaxID=2820405 RepID=UPI002FE34853